MYTAGTDYTSLSRNLTFNAAVTTEVVEVLIIDNHIVEYSEVISLTLVSTDSAVILNPSTSTIIIEDVDSKLLYGYCMVTISVIHSYSLFQWLQLDSAAQPILWVKMQAVLVSQCLYKVEPWTEMS